MPSYDLDVIRLHPNLKENNFLYSPGKPSPISDWLAPDLTSSNLTAGLFNSFLRESVFTDNRLVLVKFYAAWCGHCKNYKPTFESIYHDLRDTGYDNNDITVVGLPCNVYKDVCNDHNVHSYPSVQVFGSNAEKKVAGWEVPNYKDKQGR